jgi:hypothetical protein
MNRQSHSVFEGLEITRKLMPVMKPSENLADGALAGFGIRIGNAPNGWAHLIHRTPSSKL